ncbi:MFS transporter [Fructilactobacillus cliffordii]|uniref:MFS transporter n=1 Tax=Fructilactobacillus cliffordii TaxID=2940299 RepID=UPI0020931BC7|nr:MFS transporter [Fructilactobacillus cliffordii]USS87158.1 MFS transporter [Fructilactobacillus cliffordii]
MQVFWQNTKFRALMCSGLLDNLGTTLFNIVFIIYASHMPNPNLAVSAVSLISSLPYVTNIIAGVFADHSHQHYRGMLATRLLQMGLFLILSGLISLTPEWYLFGILLLLNFLTEFLGSYGGYLMLPIFKKIVPEQDLTTARGFQGGVGQSISLIGGMVGASLLALLNQNYVLFALVNAVTFLLSYIILKRHQVDLDVPVKQSVTPHSTKFSLKTIVGEMKNNYGSLRNFPQLFHFVLLFAMTNLLTSMQEVLMTLTLLHYHSLILFNYGFTVALVGAVESGGMIVGSFFGLPPLRRASIESNVILVLATLLGLFLDMLVARNRIVMIMLVAIVGYLCGILFPKIDAFIMKAAPEEQLGTIMSAINSLVTLTIPLGSLVVVALGNLILLTFIWGIMCGLGVLGVGYAISLWKRYQTYA